VKHQGNGDFYLEPAALEAGRDYLVMPSPGRYVRVTILDAWRFHPHMLDEF
jgi:hypothetical protein